MEEQKKASYGIMSMKNINNLLDKSKRSKLSFGVSNTESSKVTDVSSRKRKEDVGHVTIVEPEEARRKRQDGFLISFRLSMAYRALERQEVIAGKPTITPQKIKRTKSKLSKKVSQLSLDKKVEAPVIRTNFWKQMISVNKVPTLRGQSPPPQGRQRKVSPLRKRKGHSRSRSPKPNNNEESSQAVKEWQRRRNIRKQNRKSRKQQIKISKQICTTRPKSAPANIQHQKKRFRKRKVAPSPEKDEQSLKVSTRPLIPISVTPRQSSPLNDRRSSSNSGSRACSTTYGGNSTRPGSPITSESSLFSDKSNVRRRTSVRRPRPMTAGLSLSQLNLSQLSTEKATSMEGSARTPISGTQKSGVLHERSKYTRKLASNRMRIPKPDKEIPRTQMRPTSAANSIISGTSGEKEPRRQEINYKACKYLYSMCDCRNVGSNKTINKLQKFRKISGVISIYGCPKDDEYLTSDLVCPFCRIFPRSKVNAWLIDQELCEPLQIMTCR